MTVTMEEAQFARELAKYKVVRRPEHIGPLQRKKDVVPSLSSTSKTSKAKNKAAAASSSAASKANPAPVVAGDNEKLAFWDLLRKYAGDRMSAEDAEKLVNTCKELHSEEVSADRMAVEQSS